MKTYSRNVKSPCPAREHLPAEYESSCRLCLTKDNIMIHIFNEDEIVPIPLKLRYCISLEVSEEDGLPCGICADCMVKLDETYAFKKRCLATDVKLRQFIQVPSFSNSLPVDGSNSKETTLVENTVDGGNSRDACTIKMEDNALLFINALCRNHNSNNKTDSNNVTDIDTNGIEVVANGIEVDTNGIVVDTNGIEVDTNDIVVDTNGIEVTNISIGDTINIYDTVEDNTLNLTNYCTDETACEGDNNIEQLREEFTESIIENRRSARIILNKSKTMDSIEVLKSFQRADKVVEDEDDDLEVPNVSDDTSSGKKTSKPSYRCTPCNITFLDYKSLLSHKHAHHAESIKMCNFCPKTFVTNSTLERHLRTHTGDRPYVCSDCGKRFSQKEILNRHSAVHNILDKRKISKCSLCNYACISAEQLHRHIRLRHSDSSAKDQLPKFPCSRCDKAFYHPSGLSRHQAVHSGVVYQCTSCIKPFSDKSSVKRHFYKCHPELSFDNAGSATKYYQIATFQY